MASSSKSTLGYHCSLCDHIFGSRKEWLSHLLGSSHQNLMRKEVSSWNSKVKSKTLMAFAIIPIANEKVLQSFGKLGRDTIVTDFVWSEKRPKVGLVQFESRAKVKEVLRRLGGSEMKFEDEDGRQQLIQLKKVTDCIELEWDGVLETFQCDKVEQDENCNSTQMETEDFIENEDVKPDISGLVDSIEEEKTPNYFLDIAGTLVKSEGGYETCSTSTSFATIQNQIPDENHPPPQSVPKEKPCLYRQQYETILREISIPDEDYSQALDVMEKCRQIFASKFPACKLFLFRHWYLKLTTPGTNELLFYVDFDGTLDGSHLQESFYDKPFKLPLHELESLFDSPLAQNLLPGVKSVPKPEQNPKFEPRAHQFHQPSGLKFSIVADSLFKTEAQTCRLLNFLLDCDPRARPFLTLIFYWIKRSRTKMSWPACKFRHKSHAMAPEPSALEWMIISFLVYKKVIPSPGEVLQRTHQKVVVFQKADIGFSTQKWYSFSAGNHPLPNENSHEFFLLLLQLVQDFFNFYGTLRSGSWILNTRDGELINKDDFLNKSSYVDWKTKLKPEEIAAIKQAGKDYRKTLLNLETQDIIILHPLFVEWAILFFLEPFIKVTDFKMMVAAATIKKNFEDGMDPEKYSLESMFGRAPQRKVDRVKDKLAYIPEQIQRKMELKKGKKLGEKRDENGRKLIKRKRTPKKKNSVKMTMQTGRF